METVETNDRNSASNRRFGFSKSPKRRTTLKTILDLNYHKWFIDPHNYCVAEDDGLKHAATRRQLGIVFVSCCSSEGSSSSTAAINRNKTKKWVGEATLCTAHPAAIILRGWCEEDGPKIRWWLREQPCHFSQRDKASMMACLENTTMYCPLEIPFSRGSESPVC